jgi:hypothetical protein
VLEEFWPTADPKAPGIAERLAEWVHYYNWHRRHEALNGSTPIDRVCERASKTPLHGEVSDAYEPAKERVQVREHAVEMALRSLKPCLWTAQTTGRRAASGQLRVEVPAGPVTPALRTAGSLSSTASAGVRPHSSRTLNRLTSGQTRDILLLGTMCSASISMEMSRPLLK